jgi:UDP-perosamine 4-acetyltransferase
VKVIYDDNSSFWGQLLMDVPIVGPIERIETEEALPTVIAIGDNWTRRSIVSHYANREWLTVIDPTSIVDASVRVGRGTVVLPGSVVQVDSQLGDHVIINTGATVDHDCRIGDYAHVAPGTNLAGNVTVGEGSLMGIRSAALPGTTINSWTVVGAGAVVTRDLPSGIVATGIPAVFRKFVDKARCFPN